VIVVYRSRKKEAIGSTKSDRFRSVEIGPGLCAVLRDQIARRAELASGDGGDGFLFVMPVRTFKRDNGRWESAGAARPFDRNTPRQPVSSRVIEPSIEILSHEAQRTILATDTNGRDAPRLSCVVHPRARHREPASDVVRLEEFRVHRERR